MKSTTLYRNALGPEEQPRRLLTNNPFRQFKSPMHENFSNGLVNNLIRLSRSAFDDWVEKNRRFIDSDEDDENGEDIVGLYANGNLVSPNKEHFSKPPALPAVPTRTGSDSNVSYGLERKMSSNNPFALDMNDEYIHYREPPAPPQQTFRNVSPSSTNPQSQQRSPPSVLRSTKNGAAKKTTAPPPPSYEEAAGPDASNREYPEEKQGSSSSPSSSSQPCNSNGVAAPPRPPALRGDHSLRRSHSESDKKGSSHHRSSNGSRRHRESGDRKDRDRERERRHKKSPSKSKPQPVKSKNLDTIDKLDVTAFFGGGFHHDGPFDACTPHRNKNVKAAPVMAFPVDGPNNSIQGLNKVDKHPHIEMAFGNYDDAQNEIIGQKLGYKNPNNSDPTAALYLPKQNPSIVNFDAKQKAVPIHGEVTPGLGSSTFLDGAPAPKAAVQVDEYLSPNGSAGIGRKKSLVQRLRKNSGSDVPRRGSHDENINYQEEETGNLLLRRVKSLKVGRR